MELKNAAKLGNKDAEYEMNRIKKKYRNGEYASLIENYAAAAVEIIEESSELHKNCARAKMGKPIKNPLFTGKGNVQCFRSLSSNPKF